MPDLDPPAAWADLAFFADTWPAVAQALDAETRPVLPPAPEVFAALAATPPDGVRVVVLGQDPYPTPGHAHGFAFSCASDVHPLPRSLSNIFREMQDDLGAHPPNGDLRFWAAQGVLLLNTALTVPEGSAGGHAKLGWQHLTSEVLSTLDDRPRAFLLWGANAQKLASHLTHPGHLKIATAHPSPLSARRGFFGSRPFSAVNAWLKARGETPINWTDP